MRILILDPHNEFACALPEYCVKVDSKTLDLPFWMFKLEEFAEVLFRGRETDAEEIDALRDLIPLAKNLYRNPNSGAYLRRGNDALTADTPVPYLSSPTCSSRSTSAWACSKARTSARRSNR